MFRKILGFAFLIWLSTSVHGVTDAEFAECMMQESDSKKLICFNAIGDKYGLSGPASGAREVDDDVGAWVIRDETNPIDDSRDVTLILVAESGKTKFGDEVVLIARCSSGEVDVYLSWHEYFSEDDAYVTERVGSQKARTRRWSLSTSNQATFSPTPQKLLEEMLTADKFLAKATPYNENPITAIFDTTGMGNAIAPLREACSF